MNGIITPINGLINHVSGVTTSVNGVIGVITPVSGIIVLLIGGTGPLCPDFLQLHKYIHSIDMVSRFSLLLWSPHTWRSGSITDTY